MLREQRRRLFGCCADASLAIAGERLTGAFGSIEAFPPGLFVAGSAPMPLAPDPLRDERPEPRGRLARWRWRRLLAIVAIMTALSPGLWWRSAPHWPRENHVRSLLAERLVASSPDFWPARLRLVGAWRLTSANSRFGGYSALLATNDDTLTAISDIGRSLRFRRPDTGADTDPRFGQIGLHDGPWFYPDTESATWDPKTGARWFGYEETNRIRRFAANDDTGVAVAPRAMRDWSANGGAESLVRLTDGRFIVLEEDPPWFSSGGRSGLLFPSDPVTGVAPLEFTFRPPIGYSPSDAAALPDGRVVVLLRTFDLPFPPFFKGMLVVADPAQIAAGKEWPWRKLADLDDPVPRDNYEGLAIVPVGDGVDLWLISDDNFAPFQRTLLLQLHWRVPPRTAPAK